jgi:hypothetical protein
MIIQKQSLGNTNLFSVLIVVGARGVPLDNLIVCNNNKAFGCLVKNSRSGNFILSELVGEIFTGSFPNKSL